MWVDNIKVDLGEIKLDGVDCIGLAHDRDKWRALLMAVMNLWVPQNIVRLIEWLHNWWPLE
jgi:hypothetical protein